MKTLLTNSLLLLFCALALSLNAQKLPFRSAKIAVTPELQRSMSTGGRLLLHFTRQKANEPRFKSELTIGITPQNWDGAGVYKLDAKDKSILSAGLDKWTSQASGKVWIQAVYKQNIDDGQENVPGNLISNIDSLMLAPSSDLELTFNQMIPNAEIVNDKFVKLVVLKSKYLTKFSGHPRFLKASVLLPSGYFDHPEKNYPICYRAPGLNGRYTAIDGQLKNREFSDWWFSGNAPQIIYVFLDSQGPYGDTYQVDSESNGPCGKAFTEELIPEIEKMVHYNPDTKMRYLTGYSTGGWVALGLQIFYPDFFDGTWSYSPDPVDFEHFGLINIYQDESIFYNRFGFLQPGRRTTNGEPSFSMKDWIDGENVVSRTGDYRISGGQFGAYNAVFGPKGNDGLPSLMFDPFTGKINRDIAKQWEKYDLKKVMENNWSTLGPKLQGKIWIWTGDMDGLYSNVATRYLKMYLDKTENPKSDAKINFTAMAGHCQEWSDVGVLKMIGDKVDLRPKPDFRAPSVPLVAHDPYFSIWSPGNSLYDCETVHWTGKSQPLHAIIRIDGTAYRLMGSQPSELEPIRQTGVKILPTRTIYSFQNTRVAVEMIFTTPALVSNPDVLSRPVTYITWNIHALDEKEHAVQLYFDCGAEVAVNTPDQAVQWFTPLIDGMKALQLGSSDQQVLQRKGDDVRIDWGYAFLAIPEKLQSQMLVGERKKLFSSFITNGSLQSSSDLSQPRKVNDGKVTMAGAWNVGKVERKGISSTILLAYDDISSVRYFEARLPAYWKRNGITIEQLLVQAWSDYPRLSAACAAFDSELVRDLEAAGGSKYATMASLVYRQCLAAHKLVADENGQPLIFSKENFSNGCMATVDVMYPASPFFFLFSPALTKAMLQPIFSYSKSTRWTFPFAPHDIGQYPFATGQVYGGGEKTEENQMPVEETGNMVIMTAALAQMEGNANFANDNWPVLERWCEYLLAKGFDPENQLCTDDFAGHLAHNINLSAKAIEALGCYSMLCEMTGRKEKAVEIRKKAELMAKEWIKQATEGDHTKLAYDRPDTWSQKYNLVWDKILGLKLFPNQLLQREIKYYQTKQGEYGLPLDNRQRYTKNDWITWTATMADTRDGFQSIFDPVWQFANSTPQRVPLSDWYITDNAYMVGFQARSVVGGFFIKMLSDKNVWDKWVKRGTNTSGPWAPLKLTPLAAEKN